MIGHTLYCIVLIIMVTAQNMLSGAVCPIGSPNAGSVTTLACLLLMDLPKQQHKSICQWVVGQVKCDPNQDERKFKCNELLCPL